MPKALMIIAEGFEEIEAVTPIDLLRRAGIEVTSASTESTLQITGGRGIVLTADQMLAECMPQIFDMLVIPGGPGVDALRIRPEILEWVRVFHRTGKALAAICAAPLLLLDAGVLEHHTVTSFPGNAERELLEKAISYSVDRIHVDGNLITARGAGVSEEFSLALIEFLKGREAAEQIRQRIVAR